MTTITFKELSAKELKDITLNLEDVSPLGHAILDGADTCVFDGQFINVYKNGTRVYEFGFTYWNNEEYYGNNGLVHVKEGYTLIG